MSTEGGWQYDALYLLAVWSASSAAPSAFSQTVHRCSSQYPKPTSSVRILSCVLVTVRAWLGTESVGDALWKPYAPKWSKRN
jgi:hypothetical protein